MFKINFYQHLALTYKRNKYKDPLIFNEVIKKPFRKYPTKFSENCFSLTAIFQKEEDKLQLFSILKKVVHTKLVKGEDELEYF